MLIVVYVAIFAALYFFMIRPNSKRKKEEAEIRNSVTVGDNIITIGGIMGRVVAVKEDEDAIVIETSSDRTKIMFKKWCISTVVREENEIATPVVNGEKEDKKEKKGFFSRKKKDEE